MYILKFDNYTHIIDPGFQAWLVAYTIHYPRKLTRVLDIAADLV